MTKRLSLDLPDEQHQKLRIEAATENTTVAAIIRRLIHQHYERTTASMTLKVTKSHMEGETKVIDEAKVESAAIHGMKAGEFYPIKRPK